MNLEGRLLKIELVASYVDDRGDDQTLTIEIPQASALSTDMGYSSPPEIVDQLGIDHENRVILEDMLPDTVVFAIKLVRNSALDYFMLVRSSEVMPTPPVQETNTDGSPTD